MLANFLQLSNSEWKSGWVQVGRREINRKLVSTKTEHENPMMGRLKIMGSLSAFLQQGEAQQLLPHLPCLSFTQVPWN
jgi:hypothetical protein